MTTPAELEALCLQARADFPAFAAHPHRAEFLRAVAAGLARLQIEITLRDSGQLEFQFP